MQWLNLNQKITSTSYSRCMPLSGREFISGRVHFISLHLLINYLKFNHFSFQLFYHDLNIDTSFLWYRRVFPLCVFNSAWAALIFYCDLDTSKYLLFFKSMFLEAVF